MENIKVGEFDEVDYMCIFIEFLKVCYVCECFNDFFGYLKICINDWEEDLWNDFLDEDGYLIVERLYIYFYFFFDRYFEEVDFIVMFIWLYKFWNYSSG